MERIEEAQSSALNEQMRQIDRNRIFLQNHEIQICAGCAYISAVDSANAGFLERLTDWVVLLPNSGYSLTDGERYRRQYEIVRRQILDHQVVMCAACAMINAAPNRQVKVDDLDRIKATYNQHHPKAASSTDSDSLGYWRNEHPVVQLSDATTVRNNRNRVSIPCPLFIVQDNAITTSLERNCSEIHEAWRNPKNFMITANKAVLQQEYGIYVTDD